MNRNQRIALAAVALGIGFLLFSRSARASTGDDTKTPEQPGAFGQALGNLFGGGGGGGSRAVSPAPAIQPPPDTDDADEPPPIASEPPPFTPTPVSIAPSAIPGGELIDESTARFVQLQR